MDLRVKKTKRAIQNAFYELLREKPAEKITVTEIVRRAEINKTTFYAHYETLDALVDELEQQTTQYVVEHMDGAYQLLEQPEVFVRNLFEMMKQTSDFFGVLPISTTSHFAQYLQSAMQEQLRQQNIDPAQYENIGALLTFISTGLAGLLHADPALAQHQLELIAAFVGGGVRSLNFKQHIVKQPAGSFECLQRAVDFIQ